jgi:16S rRNA (guanine(966)-N(2))-methyltransferase RsmD
MAFSVKRLENLALRLNLRLPAADFRLASVQVLAGKYRRRYLQSLPSPRVRPTARRMRETLFDFLGARIIEVRFVDLCAGSGAVGIEALSRGAAHVTFVERSARICNFIESNLGHCEVSPEQIEIIMGDAIEFLRDTMMSESLMWDIAFFDPPYAADYAPVLSFFGAGAALKRKSGVLVVEHHCENRLQDTIGVLRRWRLIRQGESCLSFYEQR